MREIQGVFDVATCKGENILDTSTLACHYDPYGLRSLWELVEFFLVPFIRDLQEFRSLTGATSDSEVPLTQEDASEAECILWPMVKHCERLGLQVAERHIRKAIKALEETHPKGKSRIRNVTARRMRDLYSDCLEWIKEEMDTIIVMHIPTHKAIYHSGFNPDVLWRGPEKPRLFSEHVKKAFPSAVRDIDEACDCYTANRNTACVFHLMRATEVALKCGFRGMAISVPN